MARYQRLEPKSEHKFSHNDIRFNFQRFVDPHNYYYCSECEKFIPPNTDLWLCEFTGTILCFGQGKKDNCLSKYKTKLAEAADAAKDIRDVMQGEQDSDDSSNPSSATPNTNGSQP